MTEQDPKDDGLRVFTGLLDVAKSVADVREVGDGDGGTTLLDVADILPDEEEEENGKGGTSTLSDCNFGESGPQKPVAKSQSDSE